MSAEISAPAVESVVPVPVIIGSGTVPVSDRRRGKWMIPAALAIGAIAGVIGARQFDAPAPRAERTTPSESEKKTDENTVEFGPEQQTATGIEVATVSPEPFHVRTWRSGRIAIHDDRTAHVCPPAEGVVREVPGRLGQSVAAGDVLAVIDSRELGQAKLEAHKARIALAAERELTDRAKTTTLNADELLKLLAADTSLAEIEKRMANKPIGDWRQQLLGAYSKRNQLKTQLVSLQSSGGAVSESLLRKTEAEAEAAAAAYTAIVEELRFQVKNQVRQAELKLKDAEASMDVAKSKLLLYGISAEAIERLDPIAEGATVSHLTLKAPFAGTVVEKHAVRSERVGPQSQMFVVADLSVVWVQVDLFEADLPLVRSLKDRPLAIRSANAGVHDRKARVVYAGDVIDKTSRSLTLIAEADNADRILKPGLFVEIGFDTGDPTPVLQVASTAILRHENKPFVFVQTGDEKFRRTEVVLGRSSADRVEIANGLKPGDKVVTRGGFVLKSELLKDQMVGE